MMKFLLSYADNFERLIPAVIIDSRVNIQQINGGIGSVIKAYADSKVAEVSNTSHLVYRIETLNGNLAGYFALKVTDVVTLVQKQLRPAFAASDSVISGLITNFINNAEWKRDYLPG